MPILGYTLRAHPLTYDQHMKKLAALAALPLLALTACSSGSNYDSAQALRDAAVKAGLDCPTFVPDEIKSYDDYKSAGHCEGGDEAKFYVWGDKDHAQNYMGGTIAFGGSALVGDSWGIKTDRAGELKDDLGGKVLIS